MQYRTDIAKQKVIETTHKYVVDIYELFFVMIIESNKGDDG